MEKWRRKRRTGREKFFGYGDVPERSTELLIMGFYLQQQQQLALASRELTCSLIIIASIISMQLGHADDGAWPAGERHCCR